jgi:hypothetical protein
MRWGRSGTRHPGGVAPRVAVEATPHRDGARSGGDRRTRRAVGSARRAQQRSAQAEEDDLARAERHQLVHRRVPRYADVDELQVDGDWYNAIERRSGCVVSSWRRARPRPAGGDHDGRAALGGARLRPRGPRHRGGLDPAAQSARRRHRPPVRHRAARPAGPGWRRLRPVSAVHFLALPTAAHQRGRWCWERHRGWRRASTRMPMTHRSAPPAPPAPTVEVAVPPASTLLAFTSSRDLGSGPTGPAAACPVTVTD